MALSGMVGVCQRKAAGLGASGRFGGKALGEPLGKALERENGEGAGAPRAAR